jgi:hypothetical protein
MTRRGKDPMQDIYRLFDEAGLGVTIFSTRKSLVMIVNEVRTALAGRLKKYIQARDNQMFQAGYNKRKEEELEQSQEIRDRRGIELPNGQSPEGPL